MDWFSINVRCSAEFADVASETLQTHGAKGVSFEDIEASRRSVGRIQHGVAELSVFEELPAGRTVVLSGYYPAESFEPDALMAGVRLELEEKAGIFELSGFVAALDNIDIGLHCDTDWETAWKDGFGALPVGDNLLVAPPWDITKNDKRTPILVDPGMAFGTGTHPSTRMCLELLEKHTKPDDLVLDVGTGSGILAVCAAKLEAKRVIAWDGDPLAVKAAVSNVGLNDVADRVKILFHESVAGAGVLPPGTDDVAGECDLVVANIAADPVISLAKDFSELVRFGGHAILSGIVTQKEQRCRAEYERLGFALTDRRADGEWIALCFRAGGE